MSLLASAGFDLYSSDPENLTSQVSAFASPTLSPLMVSTDDNASVNLLDLSASVTVHTISPESGAVFTRSRSSTDPERSPQYAKNSSRTLLPRSQSHSPSACEVRILEPDLTSIGLSDDTADMWTTKIIKLLAFPDLISCSGIGRSGRGRSSAPDRRQPSLESDFPSTPPNELDSVTGTLGDTVRLLWTLDSESDSSSSQTDDTTRDGLYTPRDSNPQSPSELLFDAEHGKPWQEDGCSTEDADVNDGSTYFSSSRDTGSVDEDDPSYLVPPSAQLNMDTPTVEKTINVSSPTRSQSASASSTYESSEDSLVPFFSFTRTPEGSSLTASVPLLAALFPPSERHMVSCCDELDILDSRAVSPEQASRSDAEADGAEESDGKLSGTLKCLQIDLRKFGLGEPRFLLIHCSYILTCWASYR